MPVGAMYGLAASGLVVVHRATRNLDLSLGAAATAAAFTVHRLRVDAGWPVPVAVAAGLVVAAAIGCLSAALARRIGPGRPLAAVVGSLALGGLVLAVCTGVFGTETQFVPAWFSDVSLEVAGTVLSGQQLLVLAAAVVVVIGGSVLLRRSWTGLAWAGLAGDRTAGLGVGLPVRRLETTSYVVAAVLAGGAGILLAPLLFLDTVQMTVFFLVKPFAAAMVAGLARLPMALAVGLAIGVAESVSVKAQSVPGLGEAVPFALVVAASLLSAGPVRRLADRVGRRIERAEPQPDGAEPQPDGAERQPDGAERQPDGAERQPDGAEPQPDGAEPQPDGAEPQPDGAEPQPDGAERRSRGPDRTEPAQPATRPRSGAGRGGAGWRGEGAREAAGPPLATGPSRVPGRGAVWPAATLVAVLLVAGPHVGPYWSTILQLGGITAVVAASHVVLTGWVGQLSLATPGLAGIGAILAARAATEAGVPFPLPLLVGAAAGAAAAAVVGVLLAGWARGVLFAAATLTFAAASAGALFNVAAFSGPASARSVAPPALGGLELTGPRYTWVVVTVAAVAFAGLRWLGRSRFGAAMLAVREHERAAVALGIPAGRIRWLAFVVTGALSGLAGALTAFQLQGVAVEQFHPLTALPVLSVAIVGGIESLWGAVLGAALLTVGPELLREVSAPTLAAALPPAVLLLVVALRPAGLTSLVPPAFLRALDRQRLGRSGAGGRAAEPAGKLTTKPARDRTTEPARDRTTEPAGGPGSARASRAGGWVPGLRRRTLDLRSTGAGQPLLVEGVGVAFGRFRAVDGMTMAVGPGEVVALIGPNGAGKTTLFDAVSGFVRPTEGRVSLGDVALGRLAPFRRLRAGCGRTFQAGGLFPRLSLRDNVDLPRRWHRMGGPPADELLAAAGVSAADPPATEVPPGTARTAELVRILALRPRVLLLDEPTAGLGRSESDALLRYVRESAGDAAVLVIEHDLRVIAATDRVVVMDQGRLLTTGHPDAIRQDPKVIEAYLGPEAAPAPAPPPPPARSQSL